MFSTAQIPLGHPCQIINCWLFLWKLQEKHLPADSHSLYKKFNVLLFTYQTYLFLFFSTPTLCHVSYFLIHTDISDKGPSKPLKFILCPSSSHHSLVHIQISLRLFCFLFLNSSYFTVHKELRDKGSSKPSLGYIYLLQTAFVFY